MRVPRIWVHATYSDLLPKIIGLEAPGLVPGGTKGARRIHRSELLPDERFADQNVAGLRGKGVDVMISLDTDLMHDII